MSNLQALAHPQVEDGDSYLDTVKVYKANTYLEVADLSTVEGDRTLHILDRITLDVQDSKALGTLFKDNPSNVAELLNLPEAKKFPLVGFEKSDKYMDASRVIDNIEKVFNRGMDTGYAMNVALLAEYGLVGDRANEFAHSRTFEDTSKFLQKVFPDGPSFSKGPELKPGQVSVGFGTSVSETKNGMEVAGIQLPKGVDVEHSLNMLEGATTRRRERPKIDASVDPKI